MRIAVLSTFTASKKEPLVAMLDRLRQAFLDAGLGAPAVRFAFGDMPVRGSTSAVDRALKRHPELARFVTEASPAPGLPEIRRIENGEDRRQPGGARRRAGPDVRAGDREGGRAVTGVVH